MTRTRLLIVDDVADVRRDIWTLLELTGEVDVVGEAASGPEALQQIERLHPDIVLMDLAMPDMDGLMATRRIMARWPSCRVIAWSIHTGAAMRQAAHNAGACAYIEKGAPLDALVEAIFPPRSGS